MLLIYRCVRGGGGLANSINCCQYFDRRSKNGFQLQMANLHCPQRQDTSKCMFNPLNAELNPMCYLLALL